MFRPGRPHPRHTQSFVRYLFPRAVRERYRERSLNFHLETLPYLKHSVQSRVYRYILERQRRRTTKTRIVDIVARQGRRLWPGSHTSLPPKDVKPPRNKTVVASRMPMGEGVSGYGLERPASPSDRERGYRRKKLAAMAGSLYRSGQAAVTEIRESYAQTRARGLEGDLENNGRIHIPGAFPDVEIMVKGNEQLVLFPSYTKRHSRREWGQEGMHHSQEVHGSIRDEEYWRNEWERNEDERAIVDVDVRGWVYSPQTGPMTRRNRMLVGLARQLSGLPPPRADSGYTPSSGPTPTNHQIHEEQEKIAHEAARIERLGQEEKRVAYRGGYSERPQDSSDDTQSVYPIKSQSGNQSPDSNPTSPSMTPRAFSSNTNELTDAELAIANANLMARIAPFMTNPLVALPITLFFYNDTRSQSKTVITNDAGHFHMRAALEFIPTHVRVLANEDLSATQEVKLIEPHGVSIISDIDDTVKRSNISMGAKEIFRNTFVRELNDLHIEGVKDWFGRMQALGVCFHYCSNSPWQLFPVLASYFKLAGLPPGSLHLKQYSGMLQGIFEPVAERKKTTLARLLKDFPERKFLLVGDSGEADLEVYTELALANPGRILAVFIRDVTTPEETAFFDQGFGVSRFQSSNYNQNAPAPSQTLSKKKSLTFDQVINNAPKVNTQRRPSAGPAVGTLIDFTDEPQEVNVDRSSALAQLRGSIAPKSAGNTDGPVAARKAAPPRPSKPPALRSAKSITELNKGVTGLGISREASSFGNDKLPPIPPRKPVPQIKETPPAHPLSQTQSSSHLGKTKDVVRPSTANTPPPPPPPRRRGTPSQNSDVAPVLPPRPSQMSSNLDIDYEPLPPPRSPSSFATARSGTRSGARSDVNTPSGSPSLGPQGVNKKVELWKRRLARAHDQLDGLGVTLYTWRRGGDVIVEAEAIVKRALAQGDKKWRP
ncbi:hypothetical protein BGZ63DRAFT_373580 [Mariannaea sp. PMI_226]|nr:hypothetical protein BGZ63DRAFT_373580 [Mariannaea sp. PMI_226]